MPYVVIENLQAGVDRRRPIYASEQGVLWEGINGHLSRGGDFEKRKAFVQLYELPEQVFGLQTVGTDIYVFGSGSRPPLLHADIKYQQLVEPDSKPMTAIRWTTLFDGKIYAIAEFDGGVIRHYYNGTEVADWTSGAADTPEFIGTVAMTFGKKVYALAKSLLQFSAVNDATKWKTTDTGAGFINISNEDEGSAQLTAVGIYLGNLAVFSQLNVQIWQVRADDALNAHLQTLRRTGTISPGSVQSFGDIDLFYLHSAGVRSLRARDSSNFAVTNDVGTLVDPLVQSWLRDLSMAEKKLIRSIIEPEDDRYWLAIGERILVFSYFPGSKISGWTWYEPGFSVDWFADSNDGTGPWVRSGNKIYKYGGLTSNEYDSSKVTCWVPFISAKKPGHFKQWSGMDLMAENRWNATLLTDPEALARAVQMGSLDGYTVNEQHAASVGHEPMVSPRLICEETGPASVSSIIIHYHEAESESG